MKLQLRNLAAAFLRLAPPIHGKGRLGMLIDGALGRPVGADAIRRVRMRDGTVLRLDTCRSGQRWAYWSGDYDGPTRRRLLSVCRTGATVLDIGANVGLWSVPLGMHVRKLGGHVWAFEPVPDNFEILREQIELNGLGETVCPVRIALGETAGEVTLGIVEKDRKALSGNAKIVDQNYIGRTSIAPMQPLDAWATENRVDACSLIKIDVEGFELGVLRGGLKFIAKHRPVIFGEFNAYWMEEAGQSFRDVFELLGPMDYQFYKKASPDSFVRVRNLQAGLEDVLLVPADAPLATLKGLGVVD